MSPDTAIALAQAEELIASAIRLISAHAGEHVAIAIGTQLVEDYARRATREREIYVAHSATKH